MERRGTYANRNSSVVKLGETPKCEALKFTLEGNVCLTEKMGKPELLNLRRFQFPPFFLLLVCDGIYGGLLEPSPPGKCCVKLS